MSKTLAPLVFEDLHCLDHVAGWHRYDLRGLEQLFRVVSVQFKSCAHVPGQDLYGKHYHGQNCFDVCTDRQGCMALLKRLWGRNMVARAPARPCHDKEGDGNDAFFCILLQSIRFFLMLFVSNIVYHFVFKVISQRIIHGFKFVCVYFEVTV